MNKEEIAEFEKLGMKYALLQLRSSAILNNQIMDITIIEQKEIYKITMEQHEIHARRMALIKVRNG